MTYIEQLKDPRWQKRRLDILQRDEWRCWECTDGTSTLHVHHRRYVRGRMPWEYPDEDLVTLCETCHARITDLKKELDRLIGELRIDDVEAVLGFAKGMRMADLSPLRFTARTYPEYLGLRAVLSICWLPKIREAVAESEVHGAMRQSAGEKGQ